MKKVDMRKTVGLIIVLILAGSLTQTVQAQALFIEKPVFVSGMDNIFEYRIPSIVTSDKGTLIAVVDARVERQGDAPNNIDLVVKRSFDNGRTWSPLQTVVDFPGQTAAADACLVVDRVTDTIWVFFDRIFFDMAAVKKFGVKLPPGIQAERSGRVTLLNAAYSKDDGATWSKPIDLTEKLKQPEWVAVMSLPGNGIQVRAGRLVVPILTRAGMPGTPAADDRAALALSDDHGKTWRLSGRLDTKTDEFSVVELVNGSLMANLRHQYREKKYRMSSVSSDGGATWSALFEETELPDPICQGSLIRFTDARDGQRVNRLLFSNAASAKARENMTVRVSYDEGKTWPLSKVVNPGAAAYSSLTVLQDGTIGLLYEYRFKNVLPTAFQSHKVHTQIIFARFNLEWLTGGKDKFTSEATSSK